MMFDGEVSGYFFKQLSIYMIITDYLMCCLFPIQLKAALISGFKNSGIVIGRKANVIVVGVIPS